MTTKECLHRFCHDCIITALRSGNKECPTCRKKLVSKRSLRPDPNFDQLIAKIYPCRDEYEAHQEKIMAKFNQSHSQLALVNSITEGIKLQSQNRPQRSKKHHERDEREQSGTSQSTGNQNNGESGNRDSAAGNNADNHRASNPPSVRSTPSPVPSNFSSCASSKLKRARSILTSERSEESESEIDFRTEGNDSNIDTEGDANSEFGTSDDIELVFRPHPTEIPEDSALMKALKENTVRYLKTTANATGKCHKFIDKSFYFNVFVFLVDHLSKYLAMRLTLDLEAELPESERLVNFCIYIASQPQQLVVLSGNQTLQQVNEKFWKVNKPMEMYYAWKKP